MERIVEKLSSLEKSVCLLQDYISTIFGMDFQEFSQGWEARRQFPLLKTPTISVNNSSSGGDNSQRQGGHHQQQQQQQQQQQLTTPGQQQQYQQLTAEWLERRRRSSSVSLSGSATPIPPQTLLDPYSPVSPSTTTSVNNNSNNNPPPTSSGGGGGGVITIPQLSVNLASGSITPTTINFSGGSGGGSSSGSGSSSGGGRSGRPKGSTNASYSVAFPLSGSGVKSEDGGGGSGGQQQQASSKGGILNGTIDQLRFVQSTKPCSIVACGGYLYHRNYSRETTDYYLCANNQSQGCLSRLILYHENGTFRVTKGHSGHPPTDPTTAASPTGAGLRAAQGLNLALQDPLPSGGGSGGRGRKWKRVKHSSDNGSELGFKSEDGDDDTNSQQSGSGSSFPSHTTPKKKRNKQSDKIGQISDLRFIKGSQNKSMLISYEGHMYRKNNYSSNAEYYVCAQGKRCNARIILYTQTGQFRATGDHTHMKSELDDGSQQVKDIPMWRQEIAAAIVNHHHNNSNSMSSSSSSKDGAPHSHSHSSSSQQQQQQQHNLNNVLCGPTHPHPHSQQPSVSNNNNTTNNGPPTSNAIPSSAAAASTSTSSSTLPMAHSSPYGSSFFKGGMINAQFAFPTTLTPDFHLGAMSHNFK